MLSRTRCACSAASADRPAASAKTNITVLGPPIAGLMDQLAERYEGLNGNVNLVVVRGTGFDNEIQKGTINIGTANRDPVPGDAGLVFNRIGYDPICLVTNPANPLPAIGRPVAEAIFRREVTTWEEVPAAKVGGVIDVLARSGSENYAFEDLIPGRGRLWAGTPRLKSSGLMKLRVSQDKAAIGWLSWSSTQGMYRVPFMGEACGVRGVASGTYPLFRNIWLVTKGAGRGETGRFVRWVQQSQAAHTIVRQFYVPRGEKGS